MSLAKLTFCSFVLLFGGVLAATPGHSQKTSSQVLLKKGFVETKQGDKLWVRVTRKTVLTSNLWIRTRPESSATLTFPGGSEIKMDENCVILVENIGSGANSVVVIKGTVLAKIKENGFKLSSPKVTGVVKNESYFFVAVLGNVERRLSTVFYVKEGKVEVTNKDTKDKVEMRLEQPLVHMNEVNWSTDLKFPVTNIKNMELYFDKGKALDEKLKEAKSKLNIELDKLKKDLNKTQADYTVLKTQAQKDKERNQKEIAKIRQQSQKQSSSARNQSQKQIASMRKQSQQQLANQRKQSQQQIARLQKQIEELRKQKTQPPATSGSSNTVSAEAEKRLKQEIEALKKKNAELAKAASSKPSTDSNAKQLENEKKFKQEIAALQEKVTKLQKEAESKTGAGKASSEKYQNEINKLKANETTLNKKIAELETKVTGLEKQLEKKVSSGTVSEGSADGKSVEELKEQIATLKEEIDLHKGDKANLTNEIAKLKGDAAGRKGAGAKIEFNRIQIHNILIGRDRARVEVASKTQALPIVMTIASPDWYRVGSIQLHAKDVTSGKTYLIYEVNPFHLNKNWAQDQFSWSGTYIENGGVSQLPAGKYYITCTVVSYHAKTRAPNTVARYWGYGVRAYYVTVQD